MNDHAALVNDPRRYDVGSEESNWFWTSFGDFVAGSCCCKKQETHGIIRASENSAILKKTIEKNDNIHYDFETAYGNNKHEGILYKSSSVLHTKGDSSRLLYPESNIESFDTNFIDSSVVEPYRILQIRKDATNTEIKNSYQRFALLYHPNRKNNIFCPNATKNNLFLIISASYETLIENESRSRLDALLLEMQQQLPQQRQSNFILTRTQSRSSVTMNEKRKKKRVRRKKLKVSQDHRNPNIHGYIQQKHRRPAPLSGSKESLIARRSSERVEQRKEERGSNNLGAATFQRCPLDLVKSQSSLSKSSSVRYAELKQVASNRSCKSDEFYSCASFIREDSQSDIDSTNKELGGVIEAKKSERMSDNICVDKLSDNQMVDPSSMLYGSSENPKSHTTDHLDYNTLRSIMTDIHSNGSSTYSNINDPLISLDCRSKTDCTEKVDETRRVEWISELPSMQPCDADCTGDVAFETLNCSLLPASNGYPEETSSTSLLGNNSPMLPEQTKKACDAMMSDSSITTKQSTFHVSPLRKGKIKVESRGPIVNFLPSLVRTKSSSSSLLDRGNNSSFDSSSCSSETTSSTVDGDSIHYSAAETNRLFGGPLSLLYRARRFKPFTDPFILFESVFGSASLHYSSRNSTHMMNNSLSNDGDMNENSSIQFQKLSFKEGSLSSPLLPLSNVKTTTARTVHRIGTRTQTAIVRTATRSFVGPGNSRRVIRSSRTYTDPATGCVKIAISVHSDYDDISSNELGKAKRNKITENRDQQIAAKSACHELQVSQWDCCLMAHAEDSWFLSILCC